MAKNSAPNLPSNKSVKKSDVSSGKEGQIELSEKELERATGGQKVESPRGGHPHTGWDLKANKGV
jgi:hypothetical protein